MEDLPDVADVVVPNVELQERGDLVQPRQGRDAVVLHREALEVHQLIQACILKGAQVVGAQVQGV